MDLSILIYLNGAAIAVAGCFYGYGRFKQIKILKQVESGDFQLESDIDSVRVKPYPFRLAGQIHVIQPMSVRQFMDVTEAMAVLENLGRKEHITYEELMAAYVNVFQKVCPTVKRWMLEEMNQPQVGALYGTVQRYMLGRAHLEAEKKSPRLSGNSQSKQA